MEGKTQSRTLPSVDSNPVEIDQDPYYLDQEHLPCIKLTLFGNNTCLSYNDMVSWSGKHPILRSCSMMPWSYTTYFGHVVTFFEAMIMQPYFCFGVTFRSCNYLQKPWICSHISFCNRLLKLKHVVTFRSIIIS